MYPFTIKLIRLLRPPVITGKIRGTKEVAMHGSTLTHLLEQRYRSFPRDQSCYPSHT